LHPPGSVKRALNDFFVVVDGDSKDSILWDESKSHQHPVKCLNKLKVLKKKLKLKVLKN